MTAPDYPPFGGPRPRKPRWSGTRKLPLWLRSGDRPEFTSPDQYVSWTRPLWLWVEGRDGLFLLSASFLIVDMGYWAETPRGQVWHERGLLYLYLATHTYLQAYGPQALSLSPRIELPTLTHVHEREWLVDGTRFTGLTSRPDCYVAPRGLPWQSGLGSIAVMAGPSRKTRQAAIRSLESAAERYYHAHETPELARSTFRADLVVSETKPCEFVVREPGWWNVGMTEIFDREAQPLVGQMQLVSVENWQEFEVDDRSGEWQAKT